MLCRRTRYPRNIVVWSRSHLVAESPRGAPVVEPVRRAGHHDVVRAALRHPVRPVLQHDLPRRAHLRFGMDGRLLLVHPDHRHRRNPKVHLPRARHRRYERPPVAVLPRSLTLPPRQEQRRTRPRPRKRDRGYPWGATLSRCPKRSTKSTISPPGAPDAFHVRPLPYCSRCLHGQRCAPAWCRVQRGAQGDAIIRIANSVAQSPSSWCSTCVRR